MQDRGGDTPADARRVADGDAEGVAAPAAPDAEDDRLLELLERWEERYQRDEDAAPESLGVDDTALMGVLRERIQRQKRLYAFLKLSPSGAFAASGDRAGLSPGGCPDAPADEGPERKPTPELPSVGRYRVLRVLGEGGFGRVYLAYDVELQRDVAVKVPIPGDASRFLDVESYLREARIVARLSHPHIVPVYDVGRTADGRYFVVSKYMEGGDLKARLGRGRPAFAESAGLVSVLCDALQYTHTQDLFHRDIKPANILLDAAGAPSLADFGLALRDEDVGRGAGCLGTAAYMSPEQARGEGHRVDGRSDIFSIGVVLYELLTGRRPFRGRSNLEILEQVIAAEPRPPRQIDDVIPGELERICLKALAKRATERYTTARDMAEDLRHFLNTASWAAPTSAITPVASTGREPLTPAATEAVDSGSRPIKIVPKGLGSFGEDDADFFLELLPGPRDRVGLPEGLRFWKTRIEASDPDRAFRVGLIYGPSGCGKSSMVKAGLLPRVAPYVGVIYVEAAGEDTEARLLRALRKQIPGLSAGDELAGSLVALRRGHGLPEGRKLLLVLDQFEQWLFARRGEQGHELVAALRQCDGEHVQALCLVRDDFWMAATRFMKDLDIDLVPGRNVAAVDLFEPRHARRVLAAYGRAYDVLPPRSGDFSRDQEAFLDAAVAGLAQDGWVVPVRLALLAEMVKGRPWAPATLRELGGTEGVGVKFLEDTFSSARAHPNHRYHQRAVQAVLKALLPETDADIKGRMRSVEELRQVSGYADRPSDFTDLVRMLDSELRLITPVDPEGPVDGEIPAPAPGGHYFQLTHDYLVHALREWLTRRQRETRRGRAELLLVERAALWSTRPEGRYLPSPREWASIRLLTRRRDWSEPQRRMMRRAGRIIGLRAAGAAILAVGLSASGLATWRRVQDSNRATHAHGLVQELLNAEIDKVPASVAAMKDLRRWTDPELRQLLFQARDDPDRRLRLGLALLPVDANQVDHLAARLLECGPDRYGEHAVLRRALAPFSATMIPRLWASLDAMKPDNPRLLAPACALAMYDPDDRRWAAIGGKLARGLIAVHNVFIGPWVDALAPVRREVKVPLAAIFRDGDRPEGQRSAAADILAIYASDDAELLADLVMEAAPRDFVETLFPVAARHADRATAIWKAELEGAGRSAGLEAKSELDKDGAAARRARAAAALLRMGETESVWPLLRHSPDPRLRSLIINWLRPLGADPMAIAAEFDRLDSTGRPTRASGPASHDAILFDPWTSRRRAVILAMGTYDPGAFAPEESGALMTRLLEVFRTDPDAGVHGATEWTLRRWGQSARIAEVERGLRGLDGGGRRWFVSAQGQTFVVVGGHPGFAMGSPTEEPSRLPHEILHTRVIRRRFAIATKEVTVGQYREFLADRHPTTPVAAGVYAPDPTDPWSEITWYEAVEFCNWLSRREGLAEVYRPNERGLFAEGMQIKAGALAPGGYRLPTEAEWEYVCRAGARTSRYYGNSEEVLASYAWYVANSGDHAHRCGTLLPNDLGLFDMLGNLFEWCQGRADDYRPDGSGAIVDELHEAEAIPGDKSRLIRGGSFIDRARDSRSAHRDREAPGNRYMTYGFRVARTLP
jgi:serine/threonine protein kinase/formylglycine-generating enzyme required for sulfatase activity